MAAIKRTRNLKDMVVRPKLDTFLPTSDFKTYPDTKFCSNTALKHRASQDPIHADIQHVS